MISIVFQNSHFLAVDKPHAWLTVPSRQGAADTRPCLSHDLASAHGLVLPVHRLDQEVSGIVLFARSPEAHRAANSWFESRQIHKRYQALTAGTLPAEKEFRWESRLVRGKRRTFEAEHGKPSVTLAWPQATTRLESGEAVVNWWLEPLTGRSHQLRYELARHGFAIVGDALYGSTLPFQPPGAIALRSVKLDFSGCPERERYGLPERLEVKGI